MQVIKIGQMQFLSGWHIYIIDYKIDKNNTNKSKLRTQFYNVEGLLKSSVDNGYTDIAKVFGE